LFLDVGKTILNIDFLNTLAKRCAALAKKYKLDEDADLGGTKSLAEFIGALEPEVPSSCPVCGSERGSSGKTAHSVIGRFFDRSYRACSVCGMIYLNRTHPPAIEYSESYFFENYKKQYGKTYLEDFPNLIAMAERRLSIIKTILTENDGSKPAANKGKIAAKKSDAPQTLLDIGCAYGAFLAVARDVGFAPRGIDISSDAARYANETLGLDVQTCNFPVDNLPGDGISVITLWYVIEHVADVKTALLKIKNSLAQGGVLAFSTPSASGISARKSMRQFLQNSPADHRIILYPRLMRRLLSCYGFDTKKIVISGHHPERFPLIGKYLKNKSSAIYKFCMVISRIFCLGDTFEVYAIKI
jgi:2-polyprenyl-3-methyl-5-hydroxy-6-metoxy-1,4-benzoquinol methylase